MTSQKYHFIFYHLCVMQMDQNKISQSSNNLQVPYIPKSFLYIFLILYISDSELVFLLANNFPGH